MVCPWTEMSQKLHRPSSIGSGKEHSLQKVLHREMLRTTKGKKMTSRRQEAKSLEIDLLVPLEACLYILTTADKRGRVKNNQIKKLMCFS
jgi:hypothetical protein